MTLPTFFIAGAPKAGTSSLYHYLSQHPQIYMSPVKEPTFFGRADLLSEPWRGEVLRQIEKESPLLRQYLKGAMRERKWLLVLERDDYLQLFRDVKDHRAVGEASVSYYWLPSAAEAIREAIPHARLIFVLRDPAEMVFSHYLATLADSSYRPFRSWFLGPRSSVDIRFRMLDAPRHVTHLTRFLRFFSRDQMRVYLYEDFCAHPQEMLRDIFRFLGVDPEHPVDLTRRYNEPVLPRFPRLHRLRKRLLGGHSLSVPRFLRPLARTIFARKRAEMRLAPEDRQLLVDHYRSEIVEVAALIGRDLSAWLRA